MDLFRRISPTLPPFYMGRTLVGLAKDLRVCKVGPRGWLPLQSRG